jgi:hypothetical protein
VIERTINIYIRAQILRKKLAHDKSRITLEAEKKEKTTVPVREFI